MKKTVYFLLLCVSAIFYSCSEDDSDKPAHSHETSQDHHVKKTKIGFQEMKNYLFEHTKSSFPASLNSTYNKDGDGYITGIDSTAITQITDGIVTSFTLRINTLDNELYAYSNLVIKSYNGQAEEYIYHYKPTAEWQTAFDTGEILPYEGEFYIADTSGEIINTDVEHDTSGRAGGSGNCPIALWAPCYGPSCPCMNGEGMTYWIPAPCPGGGESSGGDYSGGNGPLNPGGFPPTEPNPGGGSGNYTAFDYFMMDLTNAQLAWLTTNTTIMSQLYNYLQTYGQPNPNGWYDNSDAVNFALWAVEYLMENPNATFNELIRNKTSFDSNTGDINNNLSGGYDTASYPILGFPQILQNWPSVPNVIPANEFVGWNRNFHPNWDCMDYAKEQIRVKGYQISNYNASGQTFQIYTDQNGVNLTALSEGLSYLKYALTNGIPVIVGIDNSEGSHNPQTDNTTDHFVVIVGTGVENGEIFFRFYDNASGTQSEGTDLDNKLYVDDFLNMILGTTNAEYYRDNFTDYGYIVTQIRKSKEL